MNAIPSFAIKRIEILKDGASAQYGSDDAVAESSTLFLKTAKTGDSGKPGTNWGTETNNQRWN